MDKHLNRTNAYYTGGVVTFSGVGGALAKMIGARNNKETNDEPNDEPKGKPS
jgi:hypothetical protein